MNRRTLLSGGLASPLLNLSTRPDASAGRSSFSFVHFSETHITDNFHAREGCRKCFAKVNELRPDFAIAGGDLVYDACTTGWRRAVELYVYYREAEKVLEIPVHHAIGNHDICGLFAESGIAPGDRYFGKRLYEEFIGPRFYSFDHKGWHFVVLDSVEITSDRQYRAGVDAAQLQWLKADLAALTPRTPVIVTTHIPLVTGYLQYGSLNEVLRPDALVVSNAREVWSVLKSYNVKALLQGHLHVREAVSNVNGCCFYTLGAVCGNWWRGPREGHPEGFSLFTVRGDELSWRYVTYGFEADGVTAEHAPIVGQSKFRQKPRAR